MLTIERYAAWKQQKAANKGAMGIRMTNAQIHADNAVKAKVQAADAAPKQEFKLKRFQNVNPRTSTKRGTGEEAYMVMKPPRASAQRMSEEPSK